LSRRTHPPRGPEWTQISPVAGSLFHEKRQGFPVERVESWRPKARERTREALETAKKTTVMNLPEQPVIEEEVE